MNIPLLVVALGGMASLVTVGTALRGVSRDNRLNLRIAVLMSTGQAVLAPDVEGSSRRRWLESILLCTGKDRAEVDVALRGADIVHPNAVVIFAAMRLAATVGGAIAVGVFLWYTGRWHGLARLYPAAAAAAIFIVAKMVLRSRVAARRRRVVKELPFTLDLMLLMLESGVSLDQCFRHIAQWDAQVVPAMQRAIAVLVDDIQKGMSYETALERWAERVDVKGAAELATLFRQTVLHGTELAPALRTFVREFAEKRLSTAREVIGKKTTQMTIVMIVFFMPALMIVIAGPAVVAVFGALKSFR
jgi:tight adherence protein C